MVIRLLCFVASGSARPAPSWPVPRVVHHCSTGTRPWPGDRLVGCGILTQGGAASAVALQRRASRRQRFLALTAFASTLVVSAVDADPAAAGTSRANLGVSAIVPAVAVLQVERQLPELTLTAADVARGYIDVPAASRLAIRTTSRSGCMLDFHPRLALFKSVSVSSALGAGDLGPDGGTLVARGTTGRVATDVSYRFHLDGDVRPGAYPWPLAVSVRPL